MKKIKIPPGLRPYLILVGCSVLGLLLGVVLTKSCSEHKEPSAHVWPVAAEPETDLKADEPYSVEQDGIDISQYQKDVRWQQMATPGDTQPGFAYLRCYSVKGTQDEKYAEYIRELRYLHIPVGTYLFYSHKRTVQEQYEQFCSIVKRDEQDLLPVIDVEDRSVSGTDTSTLCDSIQALAALITEGYGGVMIYTNQNFFNKYLSPACDMYPLWIANIHRPPDVGEAKPVLHQYSWKGHIRGIYVDVDLDSLMNGATLDDIKLNK